MIEVRYEDSFTPTPGPTAAGLLRTASNGGTEGVGRSGVVRVAGEESTPSIISVREAERGLPVLGEVDVLVCGGGPAGTGAAIASARTGAKTLLLEKYGFLGGMATAGLVTPHFDCFLNKGINAEMIEQLKQRSAWGADFWKISFDPEKYKHVSEDMVLESGSDLLYHTFAVAALVEDDRIRGAVVETKSGRFAILAKVVVDCTGDGDVAARAGAPFAKGREEDGRLQPMTMMFRMGGVEWIQTDSRQLFNLVQKAIAESGDHYRLAFEHPWAIHLPNPGEVALQLVHVRDVDATDVRDMTRAEIEGRRQSAAVVNFLTKYVPEFQNSFLVETATQIGVRETRRILGDYVVTGDDVMSARKFDDGIATVSFPIDIHEPDKTAQTGISLPGAYDIPYRSLVPRTIEQLLVAGRCISGTYEAHASYRVKGPCMAMGQAAGTAAALSVEHGVTPRELDTDALRAALEGQGVRLHETLKPDRTVERSPEYRRERTFSLAGLASTYHGPG
jgi:ribulose 1,5-bisphosphate synthetase/thiazole synthase